MGGDKIIKTRKYHEFVIFFYRTSENYRPVQICIGEKNWGKKKKRIFVNCSILNIFRHRFGPNIKRYFLKNVFAQNGIGPCWTNAACNTFWRIARYDYKNYNIVTPIDVYNVGKIYSDATRETVRGVRFR